MISHHRLKRNFEFLCIPKNQPENSCVIRIETKNGFVNKVYIALAQEWFSSKKSNIIEISGARKKIPFASLDKILYKISKIPKEEIMNILNNQVSKSWVSEATPDFTDEKKPKWLVTLSLVLEIVRNILYITFTILFLKAVFKHLTVKREVQSTENNLM